MGLRTTIRSIEAAARRQEREAAKQLRELERQVKEQAKLSELEQARLEVEAFEKRLEVLLSVHKEQSDPWDWAAVAGSLPAVPPVKRQDAELKAKQSIAVLPRETPIDTASILAKARQLDETVFQDALEAHSRNEAEYRKMKGFADRILSGEHKAYTETLVEFGRLGEISDLGSSLHFTVHDKQFLECVLKVNGMQAIPSDIKTISPSGKLSKKPMPRARFHEIYQDYVCGCMLRVAREVFALLPVDYFLITATVDMLDSRTGQYGERPVMSALMPRATMIGLNFDRLDPSDAMVNFPSRGDFKASRKTGAFVPIVPLMPNDLYCSVAEDGAKPDIRTAVRKASDEIALELSRVKSGEPNLKSQIQQGI